MAGPADTRDVPDPAHGFLPLVVPVDARRFRVADPGLAATLVQAGAALTDASPDVEIGPPRTLRGDATLAIVDIGVVEPRRSLPRPARAGLRLAGAATVLTKGARARRAVRRLGYGDVAMVRWNRGGAVPFLDGPAGRPAARNVLPLRGLVVARHASRTVTAIVTAAAQAAEAVDRRGATAGHARLGSSGVVIVARDGSILRVALGAAGALLEAEQAAQEALTGGVTAGPLASVVPRPLGRGEVGLATWALESRLPGSKPSSPLSGAVRADCLDVLVALHRHRDWGARGPTGPADGEVIAGLVGGPAAARVLDLEIQAERSLAAIPRGGGHGDFWAGNLLVQADRLTGVVDWSGAGGGRLPLLDLLHLVLSDLRETSNEPLGVAVAHHLLPGSLPGADLMATYADRLGLGLSGDQRHWLAVAYWLHRLAREILDPDGGPDRRHEDRWVRDNVLVVLEAVGGNPATWPRSSAWTR